MYDVWHTIYWETSNVYFIALTLYVLLFYLNLNFLVKNRYMLLHHPTFRTE